MPTYHDSSTTVLQRKQFIFALSVVIDEKNLFPAIFDRRLTSSALFYSSFLEKSLKFFKHVWMSGNLSLNPHLNEI